MIERIKAALAGLGVERYRINEDSKESAELFFVKKQLDTRRAVETRKFEVTVFRDVESGGEKKRGFTSVTLLEAMDDERLRAELADAWYAAQFAANPYYELTDPHTGTAPEGDDPLSREPLAACAAHMARALFAPDEGGAAFVNSAEVFAVRTRCRILSSEGTDVTFTDANINGEFVVQCKEPEDVELHNTFSYDKLDGAALTEKVREALGFAADRARAKNILRTGQYDVVFSGDAVREILSFYSSRAEAALIYPGYSTWKTGERVQGENITGAALDLDLCATIAYSAEGIPMEDRPLLRGGVLETVHGPNRFCRYLGVPPTGTYKKLRCLNTGVPFDALKAQPCLWVVKFSDFQMDSMEGTFAGEIRLAYLLENGEAVPVTGGSVNGSLLRAQSDLAFSSERYEAANYSGPYAMRVKNVSIAGAE